MIKNRPLKISYGKNCPSGLSFYKLFWIFLFGGLLGVIWETLYCFVSEGVLDCRWGLIYGPFNPVYGFGAVVLTLVLNKISHLGDFWIFLICSFIGGAFEFLCSFVQEKLFGTISWNYDYMKFNFGGRTNLLYSFFWGLLGLFWMKKIYPRFSNFLDKMPQKFPKAVKYVTAVAIVFTSLNILISALAVERQTQRLHGKPANSIIAQLIDIHYPDEFLKKVYPNMRAVN